jgi:hypothetical protein
MMKATEEAASAAISELTVCIGAGRAGDKIIDRENCDA